MNKHILKIKELVVGMGCLGTSMMVDLELNELEKLIESKESINNNDCIADVISCSWTLFADDTPSEGYIAVTDGKDVEIVKCRLREDGEMIYSLKQLTEYVAWINANNLMNSLNSL